VGRVDLDHPEAGGQRENRMRLPLRVAERLRGVVPQELPLFVRISATDWVEGGWDVEQSVVLARQPKGWGWDLIDISSGALVPRARIPVSARLKKNATLIASEISVIIPGRRSRSSRMPPARNTHPP
jgi:2,4-dienoyl-CoA reductase-like NADH-dependent reductase (Old Yellow Enzyme family)